MIFCAGLKLYMGLKNMIDNCKLIDFPQKGDERGQLVIVEGSQDISFEIKRVFYIYGSDKNVIRGRHANYKSEFVLINVAGTSKVKVDDGKHQKVFELNRPHIGIYIPKLVWKDMYDFSEDSVLLVLASEHYDAHEYIRDYNEFLAIIKELNDEKQVGKG